ncbi:MAG: hypothetical protein RR356_07345 [Bacteroidales bacterium]
MANQPLSFDIKNTSSKETIRRNIRHALSSKSPNTFPNIDINSELFEPIPDLLKEFVVNFRAMGGKYIPCTKENFVERLLKLIASQQYQSLLNTSTSLTNFLVENEISFYNVIDANSPVDAALVYADILIARSGSFVCSQKSSLYPSVKNLAQDLIIVSFLPNIVSDIKNAIALQQKRNQNAVHEMTEIVTPAIPPIIDGKENYSPLNPRYILLLIA